jgi:hypothetical protein
MPGMTGVVQDDGVPLRPSISTAGAEGVDHVGGAELRNGNARFHRSAHDRGAFGHCDLEAVDGQRDLFF